jgi:hypothetical protein
MSKRFYPESYEQQADQLMSKTLKVSVVIGIIVLASFFGIYWIGL